MPISANGSTISRTRHTPRHVQSSRSGVTTVAENLIQPAQIKHLAKTFAHDNAIIRVNEIDDGVAENLIRNGSRIVPSIRCELRLVWET